MFPQDGSKHGQISEALLCGVKVERCGSRASDSEVRLQAPDSDAPRWTVCVCVHACVCACMRACMCTRVCMRAHTHTCAHTHQLVDCGEGFVEFRKEL